MQIRAGLLLGTLLVVFFTSTSTSCAGAASADASFAARGSGTCDISFLVDVTFHDVTGSARCQAFSFQIARDASGKEVVPIVEVEVPVEGMETGNKSRDKDMREMLRATDFPRIHASARDLPVDRLREEIGKGNAGDASIPILLRIRDVERTIRAAASNLKESGEQVSFDIEFPVSLKEFGLKAPSVFGIVRVGDKVTVKTKFQLTVSRTP
jgi:polyisoprenoid-binding protein YceI